jgi:hypothetical protein
VGLVKVFFASDQTLRASMLAGDTPAALYTISSDGALHAYAFTSGAPPADILPAGKRVRTDGGDLSGHASDANAEAPTGSRGGSSFATGTWTLSEKFYFKQDNTTLTAADFHAPSGLLVTTFSSGSFLLHQLPSLDHLQTLSISCERISSAKFNATGEWIALGCAALGQLLVWEWRSETHVLKQQVQHLLTGL